MSFTGRMLEIDLAERRHEVHEIEPERYERWLGTIGIAYEIADSLSGDFDPLSEDNFIVFSAGILANTPVPGATKVVAVTKNPLNRTYGPSVGGGAFARDMKRAGFDFIVIRGRADKPVWIDVFDGEVEIRDAGFWGKDALESYELLKEKGRSVLTIGQAGENLVRYALALIDGIHHLGKAGLGAVMGSKNLKAIRVGGTGKAEIANEDGFREAVKEFRESVMRDKVTKIYAEMGIMAAWDSWAKHGYLARRMKSEAVDEGTAKEFGVEKYLKEIKLRSTGCHGCPSPCKAILKAEVDGREVVTPASLYLGVAYEFGVKCGVESAEKAVLCHDVANRLGIDAMMFAELFDILATLKEEGKADVDIERSAKSVIELMEKTTKQEGIGELLAKGIDGLKERYEFEDYFIKKMEPLFDPRVASGSEAFGLLTNPRGAQEGPVTITVLPGRRKESIERYMRSIGASEELIAETFRDGFNPALFTLAAENWLWALNGLALCRRESIARSLNVDMLSKLFSNATGIEASGQEIVEAGGRAFTLARKLNCSEGYSFEDDLPPKKFFEPLRTWEGEKVWRDYLTGRVYSYEDVVEMLRQYYRMRGWGEGGCP
ncbi:Aldehyde:ferredoxin oxidoreductase [Geoglobus ahangari]|uniref:Aldehyde:ferredoxin oxidoreductase n=1 Tax=Geoglobus ahangari TaxID=113653 RepID=A0A0F7IH55_9EURY|nr:aldehyde ferredoxin oxidoreductase N-terminal domain-containing protein [Geoglobus ahangari]AKG92235.1 Aldehyde:ferredoxin oxidoreductase [Geoglobus ahangari]